MRTLFVNTSLRPNAKIKYLPVGFAYVVTAARDAGFDFDILDLDINVYSDEYVEQYVQDNKYDVIAFGAISTHYRWVKWFVDVVKQHQPSCKVIIGNSVGSSISEIIFSYTKADIVVLGEGDITIVEVLRALEEGTSLGQAIEPLQPVPHRNGSVPSCVQGQGIPGIVFRDAQGRAVHNGLRKAARRIDDLPFPDWDFFDVPAYVESTRGSVHNVTRFTAEESVVFPINTARGCVFKCTFCHYVFWNDPYRHRSPDSVLGEIRQTMEKYGANYFNFWDELSFHKLEPAEKFVDALLAADLNIHWTAAVRSDLFGDPETPREYREEVARKFKQAGCVALGFSLESGNDEILAAMNKRVKAAFFDEQVEILRKHGITCDTSLVIGYPMETTDTIAQTMTMCERNRIYPSVGFLLPLPSTGIWDYALKNGLIIDPEAFLVNVTERQDVVLNMTGMSDETMLGEVTRWLQHLNRSFGNLLDADTLIRTGGYEKHNKHQTGTVADGMHKVNDGMNYATVEGKF